ncbi:agglutinin-2-like [Salvia hispanica]|uniref:agglutinin-2-like n=1 Tax=Salvia hispanica TaxID=49212 RepID=UPI00200905D6|nr:agglutinin-2-like [Salvia hispanica]
MANLLQTLISLLSFIALLLAIANTARSQTTSFTYHFNGQQPTDLLYQGDAHFPSDSTYLRLINTDDSGNPLPYRVGRAVYSNPIQFWGDGAQVDFETTLKFIINPVDSNPADGITFFIQPVGSPLGASGGALGVFRAENPFVFAVEFDAFINANDPNYRHVGIDIGSNVSKNTTDVGDAILGQEVTARINYQQASKLISVQVITGSQTFELSYVYDLSTLLPQQVEVGLSASTGGAVAVFDVIAWCYSSTLRQTTSFQYDFNGERPTDLIYQGDAHFPSDSTNLRMINADSSGRPLQNRVGRAIYSKPIQFWGDGAQVDLETTIKFIINSVDSNPADGFTFFIQPVGNPIGASGGAFGIFGSQNPSVFAVEFDTFINSGDPNYRHAGIDIDSNVSKNTTNVGDAFLLGQEVTARINYQQSSKLISVHVTAGSETFEVSYVYDLSTFLPQQVEVGISASTGGAVAVHDLISWYFTSTPVQTSANCELEDAKLRQYV